MASAPFKRSHRRQRTETDILAACGAPLISPLLVVVPSRTAPSSPAMPIRDAQDSAPIIFIPDMLNAARFQRRDFEREDVMLLSLLPPPMPSCRSPVSRGRQGRSSMEMPPSSARSVSRSRALPSPMLSGRAIPGLAAANTIMPGSGNATPRTPSPLLPTIQNTDEDNHVDDVTEDDETAVEEAHSDERGVRARRQSQMRGGTPHLLITVPTAREVVVSKAAATASPSPLLSRVPPTPVDEKASTLSPLPTPSVLMQRRRRVNSPMFISMTRPSAATVGKVPVVRTPPVQQRRVEGEPAPPRRNSYQWDRRPTSAFRAALEARDRSSTPPRRLSVAGLWNSATASLMGRLGFNPGGSSAVNVPLQRRPGSGKDAA